MVFNVNVRGALLSVIALEDLQDFEVDFRAFVPKSNGMPVASCGLEQ